MDLIWSDAGGLIAVGPNTTAFLAPLRNGASVVGVRLHPGAAPSLFGVAAPALRDARLPADALWGDPAKRLAQRLATTDDSHRPRPPPCRLPFNPRDRRARPPGARRRWSSSRRAG